MSTHAQGDHRSRRDSNRVARSRRRPADSRHDGSLLADDGPSARTVRAGRSSLPLARAGEGQPSTDDSSNPAYGSSSARQSGRATRAGASERQPRSSKGGRQARTRSQRPKRRENRSLPARVLDGISRHRRPLIAVGIVLVVFLALYGPIQRYYVAWRTQGDEQAKADYLNSDNDALKEDIDRLTTRSGVENEARQRGYRYPSEGEQGGSANANETQDANVSSSSDDGEDADTNSANGNASDEASDGSNGNAGEGDGSSNSGSGTADATANHGSDALNSGFSYDDIQHPWYIHVFDFIFAYSSPTN